MQPKSGLKTTEFWSAIIGAMAAAAPALLSALGGYPWVAAVLGAASVALPAVYIWGRAVLKAELAKTTDVLPDAWEPVLAKVLDIAETLAKSLPDVNKAKDNG